MVACHSAVAKNITCNKYTGNSKEQKRHSCKMKLLTCGNQQMQVEMTKIKAITEKLTDVKHKCITDILEIENKQLK